MLLLILLCAAFAFLFTGHRELTFLFFILVIIAALY